MKTFPIIIGLTLLINFLSCTQKSKQGNTDKQASKQDNPDISINDTTELTNFLITIYKWHEKQGLEYYFIEDGRNKLGIDTIKLDSSLAVMKKTNFFSDGFLNTYLEIGRRMDYLIKQDTAKYKAGMIDFPFQDYDTWRGGNGLPPDWNSMKLCNVKIDNENASFKWKCNNPDTKDFYLVKFKRVNNNWRLDYLQGQELKNY